MVNAVVARMASAKAAASALAEQTRTPELDSVKQHVTTGPDYCRCPPELTPCAIALRDYI